MRPFARSVLLHGILGAGLLFVVMSFILRLIEGTLAWPRTAWELAVIWLVGGGVYGLIRWALERRWKRA